MIYSPRYAPRNVPHDWKLNNSVRALVHQAEATLAAAGVASPRYDATQIAASLLECSPLEVGFIQLADLPAARRLAVEQDFAALIARRAAREPLQHILGVSYFGPLELAVGPGVFIPRPETELLADFALTQLQQQHDAAPAASDHKLVVLDLCAGSGAISGYLAHGLNESGIAAEIAAVELSAPALAYTRKNVADLGVTLIHGDATDLSLLSEFIGRCDAVVSNPPYVPESSTLSAEVYADPAMAVFSGIDGMEMISQLLPVMAQLVRPGGFIALEHDDTTQDQVLAQVRATGFTKVIAHQDWANNPRFVSAVKPSC